MAMLRESPSLPVHIVEDHDEALQPIYRAIGSRILPFSNITILHLDAHPDLLVPHTLQADGVLDKDYLYSCLSIENWLIPAVYAGHIDHVIWLKPPWSSQIADSDIRFWVGMCPDSGEIRLSCKENYFVSEALFCPESKLLNKKPCRLTVITLPLVMRENVENPLPTHCDTHHTSKSVTQSINPKPLNTDSVCCSMAKKVKLSDSSDEIINNCEQSEVSVHSRLSVSADFITTSQIVNTQNDIPAEVVDLDDGHSLSETCGQSCRHTDQCNNLGNTCDEMHPYTCTDSKCDTSNLSDTYADRAQVLISTGNTSPCAAISRVTDQLVHLIQENTHYILDIDLDFFSTKNPFMDLLSRKQYGILQRLYKFDTPPVDCSEQVLEDCVTKRKSQLSELHDIFQLYQQEHSPSYTHEHRSEIESLVDDLRQSHDEVPFEIIHDAGCTCDDTELPHHISNQAQITALLQAVEALLSALNRPRIVTIARSSLDDYCPSDQVDMIQTQLVTHLRSIYNNMTITDHHSDLQDGHIDGNNIN